MRRAVLTALAVALAALAPAASGQNFPHLIPSPGPMNSVDPFEQVVAGTIESLRVDGLSFGMDRNVIAR